MGELDKKGDVDVQTGLGGSVASLLSFVASLQCFLHCILPQIVLRVRRTLQQESDLPDPRQPRREHPGNGKDINAIRWNWFWLLVYLHFNTPTLHSCYSHFERVDLDIMAFFLCNWSFQ